MVTFEELRQLRRLLVIPSSNLTNSSQTVEADRIPLISFASATPKISIIYMNTAVRIYLMAITPLLAVKVYLISYRSH